MVMSPLPAQPYAFTFWAYHSKALLTVWTDISARSVNTATLLTFREVEGRKWSLDRSVGLGGVALSAIGFVLSGSSLFAE